MENRTHFPQVSMRLPYSAALAADWGLP
jgi:hypothetical protein